MADETKNPDFVPFGSALHRALLGVDDPNLPAGLKEGLELAVKTKPKVVSTKRPVTAATYSPRTRHDAGDNIIDGWRRKGR